jgi:hypothetical protein
MDSNEQSEREPGAWPSAEARIRLVDDLRQRARASEDRLEQAQQRMASWLVFANAAGLVSALTIWINGTAVPPEKPAYVDLAIFPAWLFLIGLTTSAVSYLLLAGLIAKAGAIHSKRAAEVDGWHAALNPHIDPTSRKSLRGFVKRRKTVARFALVGAVAFVVGVGFPLTQATVLAAKRSTDESWGECIRGACPPMEVRLKMRAERHAEAERQLQLARDRAAAINVCRDPRFPTCAKDDPRRALPRVLRPTDPGYGLPGQPVEHARHDRLTADR